MTDPLSGCTVYFGTITIGHVTQHVMCHANALCIQSTQSQQYMTNLLTNYSNGGYANHSTLVKGTYLQEQSNLKQAAELEKRNLGRIDVAATADAYTGVFAIRIGGVWNAHYQVYTKVDSTRTGISIIKGNSTSKSRVNLIQL